MPGALSLRGAVRVVLVSGICSFGSGFPRRWMGAPLLISFSELGSAQSVARSSGLASPCASSVPIVIVVSTALQSASARSMLGSFPRRSRDWNTLPGSWASRSALAWLSPWRASSASISALSRSVADFSTVVVLGVIPLRISPRSFFSTGSLSTSRDVPPIVILIPSARHSSFARSSFGRWPRPVRQWNTPARTVGDVPARVRGGGAFCEEVVARAAAARRAAAASMIAWWPRFFSPAAPTASAVP